MGLKQFALIIVALCGAGCATAYRAPSAKAPPPLWSGQAGWEFLPAAVHVNEGVRQPGDVIVEHDARLIRTGIVKEAIRMKNADGTELIIPKGAKAFAMNVTLLSGPAAVSPEMDAIDWCVFLPQGVSGGATEAEAVCIFWESARRARYQVIQGGFVFLPSVSTPSGIPGAVPQIEEQAVDFGLQFKRQVRMAKLDQGQVVLHLGYGDGTHFKRSTAETYPWNPDGTFLYEFAGTAAVLTLSADRKTVNVGPRPATQPQASVEKPSDKPIREYPVVLDLLVGIDGRVKDARIAQSSGSSRWDAAAIAEVKRSWQLVPAKKDGRPIENWGKFSVVIRTEE
jgi:TonB family protein